MFACRGGLRSEGAPGYQYNGKPWIAIELGYSFLQ